MFYRVLADLVVLLHFAHMVFTVLGGLLVLRWWRVAWVHLPMAAWAAIVELYARYCPLTPLENHLRQLAGQPGYSGGFIDHYIMPLIYPPGLTPGIQDVLGLLLLSGYVIVYWVAWRLHLKRRQAQDGSGA
jgi:hypothetical protein